MSDTYHDGNRLLQDRFDTRRLADRIDEKLVDDVISADDKAFIQGLDMIFLATADEQGCPNCSYKGGEPGFVRVLDEHMLAFPNYDGNGMYLSAATCWSTLTSGCSSSASSGGGDCGSTAWRASTSTTSW